MGIKRDAKTPPPPAPVKVGGAYVIRGYHTGDFRGVCIHVTTSLANRVAYFRVFDPGATGLRIGDEIAIPYELARFAETAAPSASPQPQPPTKNGEKP